MEALFSDFTVLQFLIICPLVFLAGFVDAVAGGGGLISLPAYLIAGLPVHSAIATNKMSSCMGTTVATVHFIRSGYVRLKSALFCVVFALAGSALGASLVLMVDEGIIKIIMLFLLPATAIYIMRGHALDADCEPFSERKTILIGMIVAFFIGIYDGFYGPGTGTFLILLLTGVAHMTLREANGLTKAINLSTNVAALTVFLLNGKVLLLLGLIAGLFNIAGNYMGARFFDKSGAKAVRPLMMIVVGIFFVKVLLEILPV